MAISRARRIERTEQIRRETYDAIEALRHAGRQPPAKLVRRHIGAHLQLAELRREPWLVVQFAGWQWRQVFPPPRQRARRRPLPRTRPANHPAPPSRRAAGTLPDPAPPWDPITEKSFFELNPTVGRHNEWPAELDPHGRLGRLMVPTSEGWRIASDVDLDVWPGWVCEGNA